MVIFLLFLLVGLPLGFSSAYGSVGFSLNSPTSSELPYPFSLDNVKARTYSSLEDLVRPPRTSSNRKLYSILPSSCIHSTITDRIRLWEPGANAWTRRDDSADPKLDRQSSDAKGPVRD